MYVWRKKSQKVIVRGLLVAHGFAPQVVCLCGKYGISGMHSLENGVVNHKPVVGALGLSFNNNPGCVSTGLGSNKDSDLPC
jgi:hypothetical protein